MIESHVLKTVLIWLLLCELLQWTGGYVHIDASFFLFNLKLTEWCRFVTNLFTGQAL